MAVQTLPDLWWVIVLMVILIGLIMALVMSQMGPRFGKFQKLMDKINRIAKENLRGVRVVKSFVQEQEQYAKFKETSNELLDLNLFIGYGFSLMQPALMLVSYLAVYVSIYMVSGMVETDPTVIGNIASFMTYMMQIMFSIIMVGFMGMQASRAFVSISRLKEVLDTESTMTFDTEQEEEVSGSIVFEDVSFTYPNDDEPTLRHISFRIEPGQMVGVVGATGAGKSTLAQLIPRLFDPQEGQILLGGKPIKSLSQATLRQTVSIVLQKAILFREPLQTISVKDQQLQMIMPWNEQRVLLKPKNLSIVWMTAMKAKWKNGAITSLVVKNNECRLRVVLLTNLRFLYWMTQHRLWMPSQKD